MKTFFRVFFGIFVAPRKTARRLIGRKSFFTAFVIYMLAIISSWLFPLLYQQDGAKLLGWQDVALHFCVRTLFIALLLFFLSGLIHLSADLLGGGGSGTSLLGLLFIGTAPAMLSAPLAISLRSLMTTHWELLLASKLVIGLWIVLLFWFFIAEVYRFTLMRALLALFIPLIIVVLCGVTIGSLLYGYPPHVPFL